MTAGPGSGERRKWALAATGWKRCEVATVAAAVNRREGVTEDR